MTYASGGGKAATAATAGKWPRAKEGEEEGGYNGKLPHRVAQSIVIGRICAQ